MAGNGGGQTIVGAAILGICILGAAFLLSRSVNHATDQLVAMTDALGEIQSAVDQPQDRRVPTREARRTGPDPSRVYKVDVDGAPARGPENAKVTIIEFSDFQCPFCGRVAPVLQQVEKEYGNNVRVVFKHLPLSMHPKAPAAHAAAEAARLQGKFWEMHDLIFANQREMSEEKYLEYAAQIGLDVDRFKKDVQSPQVRDRIQSDAREAAALGVSGTPSFFVNGRFMSGAKPFSEFKQVIDAQLAG